MTVKGEVNQLKSTNGNWGWIGDGGRNAMKLSAPIVMMGAVSPMARDIPTIAPVRIPGRAAGSRYILTACHLSAPRPYAASRVSNGMLRSEEHTSELQSQSNLVC